MITLYKTRNYRGNIEKVQATRATDKSVWFPDPSIYNKKKERREHKKTNYVQYWDNWEDAHNFLVTRLEVKLEGAKRNLAGIEAQLKYACSLKPGEVSK